MGKIAQRQAESSFQQNLWIWKNDVKNIKGQTKHYLEQISTAISNSKKLHCFVPDEDVPIVKLVQKLNVYTTEV